MVNGSVVTRLDVKVDPLNDHIRVDGKLIKRFEPKIYIVLNKPRGILCTRMDPSGRPVVTDLLRGVKFRLYPVGRLDANSEGLVILTNDGDFFQRLVHPKYRKTRTYHVKVGGKPDAKGIKLLRQGVNLSDGPTQPADVKLIKALRVNSWWHVVVREGRNRLVRRMFERIGHPVLRLIRVKYGPLGLGDLKPGHYRHLTREEVNSLLKPETNLRARRKRGPAESRG